MRLVLPSEEFVVSDVRPRRAYIAFFLRWYSLIIGLFVTVILAVNVVPYAASTGITALVAYWIYYVLRLWIQSRADLRDKYRWRHWQLIRSLGLILGVTALHVYLYLATNFLTAGGSDHTLWLLFLLGTLNVSQRGFTEDVIVVVACAEAALVGTTLLAVRTNGQGWITLAAGLDLTGKVAWLAFLSITFHLFIRFVGNLFADVRLLHEVTDEMLEREQAAISVSNETAIQETVQTMVSRIAVDYNYPDVNFLQSLEDGSLQFMASSSPAGAELIENRFKLSTGRSIILQAATTRQPILANDAPHHPDYRPHPLFPRTKAEMAIPVLRQEHLLGVLDIQAHRPQSFMEHDLDVMGVFAGQMARALENVRAHKQRGRHGRLIQDIAGRLLSESALAGTLQEITDGAQELLDAGVITLYERNPSTSVVNGPIWSGTLEHPELMEKAGVVRDDLLERLFADTAPAYYHHDIEAGGYDTLFEPGSRRRDPGRPSFEERENVRARAILRLQARSETVGLMFVNFRHAREFDTWFKDGAQVFARLAALAIRQVQMNERELAFQRNELAAQLHDSFGSAARSVDDGIREVLQRGQVDSADKERLSACREPLTEMLRNVAFTHRTLEDVKVRPLSAEAEAIADRIRRIYGIRVDVDWQTCANDLPDRFRSHCKLMLDELVINAMVHGHATLLSIRCTGSDGRLSFEVSDNGEGFDPSLIQPDGLNHVQERAIRLGGSCVIQSAPGEGTCVRVDLPLQQEGRPR